MNNFVIQFFVSGAAMATVLYIARSWIETRIRESIKHEYDRELEKYRQQLARSEKAEKIATLFARWIKYGNASHVILNSRELLDYKEDLTRLSLELSLWIDDEELLVQVMRRLSNNANTASIRDIIIKTRELLLGKKSEVFKAEDIVIWPAELDGKTPITG